MVSSCYPKYCLVPPFPFLFPPCFPLLLRPKEAEFAFFMQFWVILAIPLPQQLTSIGKTCLLFSMLVSNTKSAAWDQKSKCLQVSTVQGKKC